MKFKQYDKNIKSDTLFSLVKFLILERRYCQYVSILFKVVHLFIFDSDECPHGPAECLAQSLDQHHYLYVLDVVKLSERHQWEYP